MPIPFQDEEDLERLGTVAFLLLQATSEPVGYRGALFQINARGEPVEFTYNRVETPNTFLWRPADIRRVALRRLTASLLTLCPRIPRLILCLAEETPPELFTQDLTVMLPVGRIARDLESPSPAPPEVVEPPGEDGPAHLFWYPAPPEDGTSERALVEALIRRGLLLEPFERASSGLSELFGEADPAES
ncbi:MAG TPA: hypothetical protein VNL71_08095 [Chloroflexota bacterium]|nr:hypothetical protein [Chloroflexota bacterium]